MQNTTHSLTIQHQPMQQAQSGNHSLNQAYQQFSELVAITQSVPGAGYSKPVYTSRLEQQLAHGQAGTQAVLCSSGALAMQLTCQSLLAAGQKIVAIGSQQSNGLFAQVVPALQRLGISIACAAAGQQLQAEPLICEQTRLLVWQSPANAAQGKAQLKQLLPLAYKYRLPLVVDHTAGLDQPDYCPLKLGATVVVAALGGEGHKQIAMKAGTIIENGTYNWGCGNYLHFTRKNPATGQSHWQTWGSKQPAHNTAFSQWVRQEVDALDVALSERLAFLFDQWLQMALNTTVRNRVWGTHLNN